MDGRGFMNHIKAKHPDKLHLYEKPLNVGELLSLGMNTKSTAKRMVAYEARMAGLTTEFDKEALQVRDDILVNHPPHYGGGDDPYEAIKVIHAWGLGFDLGNVLKYIRRVDCKGTPIQDLEKAKFYLEDEIKRRKEVASFDAQT